MVLRLSAEFTNGRRSTSKALNCSVPTFTATSPASEIVTKARLIGSHARFFESRNILVRNYLEIVRPYRSTIQVITDETRHILSAFILSRQLANNSENSPIGAKGPDIVALCGTLGVGGRNQIGALLRRLRKNGYLSQVKDRKDGRTRRIIANPLVLTICRQIIELYSVELLRLGHASLSDISKIRTSDLYIGYIAEHLSNYFEERGPLSNLLPGIKLFVNRQTGYEILLQLLVSSNTSKSSHKKNIHFNFGVIAERFSVSRTHVRRLIRDADDNGYLNLLISGGQAVEVSDKLIEETNFFLCLQLALFQEALKHANDRSS
ncbi:hypothetical protein [Labrys neptuniae]|uniref:MarR family transcriptional regulator n=1 Tax=Labrys neptuniae TaxID=376174 RepID=A0ABV3PWB2_9HYPH